MKRTNYRIVLQLDRSWCRDEDGAPDFTDPVEVWTSEEHFSMPSVKYAAQDDARGRALMGEVLAAVQAVLAKHGAERPS